MRRVRNRLAEFLGIKRSTVENPSTGRRIKRLYEDFIVEEITPEGDLISIEEPRVRCYHHGRGYVRAALIKAGRETHEVIRYIAKRLGVRLDHISFAGTKDKRALTAQRISIRGVSPEEARIEEENIKLLSPIECGRPIRLGELRGNRFTIRLRGSKRKEEAREELVSKGFINYYGFQRFGAHRPISHIIGKLLLLDRIEEAFDAYIAAEYLDLLPIELVKEPLEAQAAREAYSEGRIKEALEMFPKSFSYERRLLRCLLRYGDKRKCFFVFPYRLRTMFVHAYQSYVRNESLSRAIDRGEMPQRRPFPGRKVSVRYAKDLLKIPASARKRFKLPGGRRNTIARLEEPVILERGSTPRIRFSLRRGSYASMALFQAFEAID